MMIAAILPLTIASGLLTRLPLRTLFMPFVLGLLAYSFILFISFSPLLSLPCCFYFIPVVLLFDTNSSAGENVSYGIS